MSHESASAAAFPLPRTARLAVFASGRGSNLASLLRAFPPEGPDDAGDPPAGRVVLVVVNVPGAPALDRAAEAGVPAVTLPWRKGEGSRDAFEREAGAALDAAGVDLICLAGFLRILSPGFTQRWAGRMVNVHPSLLPAHRGLHAQRQALEAGVATTGCTIHLVDAGVDTGRVLLQREVEVRPGDTVDGLSARIREQEHLAYPAAVRALLRGAPATSDRPAPSPAAGRTPSEEAPA